MPRPLPFHALPAQPGLPALKGRGSARAVPHRYAVWQREPSDDGWGVPPDEAHEADAPRIATQVQEVRCKSALNRNDSPDLGFTQSVNPIPGMRTRLQLLLRQTRAQLPQPVAWPGL